MVYVAPDKIVPEMQVLDLPDGYNDTFYFKRIIRECPRGYRPYLESIQMIAAAEVSLFRWGLADTEEESVGGVARLLPLDTQNDITTYYDNGEADNGFPMLKTSAGWWVPYVRATVTGTTAECFVQAAYHRLPCCKPCTDGPKLDANGRPIG